MRRNVIIYFFYYLFSPTAALKCVFKTSNCVVRFYFCSPLLYIFVISVTTMCHITQMSVYDKHAKQTKTSYSVIDVFRSFLIGSWRLHHKARIHKPKTCRILQSVCQIVSCLLFALRCVCVCSSAPTSVNNTTHHTSVTDQEQRRETEAVFTLSSKPPIWPSFLWLGPWI